MTIDKSGLTDDEKLLAEQCENAINGIRNSLFSGLAVLNDANIYGIIQSKIPESEQTAISNIITDGAALQAYIDAQP